MTTDEIKDPQNLDMWLDVNGERRQTGNTRTMIFGVAELVADVSQLHDAAAGRRHHHRHAARRRRSGMKPPHCLKAGDVVTLGIQGLGEQRQKVVPFKGRRVARAGKRRRRPRRLPECHRAARQGRPQIDSSGGRRPLPIAPLRARSRHRRSPRAARLRISAPAPNVHGAIAVRVVDAVDQRAERGVGDRRRCRPPRG